MPARKIPEKVCVLAGKQVFTPYVGACRSREHGHITGERAALMVNQGLADWIEGVLLDRNGDPKVDGKGKERMRREPAIRLGGRKRWKAKVSDRAGVVPMYGRLSGPMKTMQLVAN